MALRPRTRLARRLRRDSTDAERILWRALRELGLAAGVRRQHPIGRFIADIAIPAYGLAIEVDGGQHALKAEADAERTRELNARGYRVLRFWNNEVHGNLEGVVATILAAIAESPTSP